MLSAFDQAFTALVQQTMGFVKHHVHYASKVIKQGLDGQLELRPDSAELQGTIGVGPGPVPIRPGIPGVVITVPSGTRCHLVYENGDPQKPAVTSWEETSVPLSVSLDAVTQYRFMGSSVAGVVNVGPALPNPPIPVALAAPLATFVGAASTFAGAANTLAIAVGTFATAVGVAVPAVAAAAATLNAAVVVFSGAVTTFQAASTTAAQPYPAGFIATRLNSN